MPHFEKFELQRRQVEHWLPKEIDDPQICGLYRVYGMYALFQKSEHWNFTHVFHRSDGNLLVLATGKVLKQNQQILAMQVIIVENDVTKVRWIHGENAQKI